ncbi:hypothetical protein [Aureibaculum luteum]|uniref:hypothetical protein n=1 Tax=Aureibaculum luteum TaxID=1548456 RepID=UPI000E530782|nr:hypothetical protein [Aureibaculum luteum]
MKKITYILIAFFLTSCFSESNSTLSTDNLINETFNKSEIKDLQHILDFFNNEICNSNYGNINECYLNYCLEIITQFEKTGTFNSNLNFEKQRKLYSKIDNNTFNEIWVFQKNLPLNERKDTLKNLELNYEGKYRNFLNEYGKENIEIKKYDESYNVSAGLSPSMFAEMAENYELFKITKLKTKLVIAIHYMTLNDQNWRNEKY